MSHFYNMLFLLSSALKNYYTFLFAGSQNETLTVSSFSNGKAVISSFVCSNAMDMLKTIISDKSNFEQQLQIVYQCNDELKEIEINIMGVLLCISKDELQSNENAIEKSFAKLYSQKIA